ncbi:MAG: HEAT repeat domain-containing protein [Chthoniobacter sp.]|nr:HEAT repeat domain-containing protein [Chthoniobacter sp.]
MRLPLLLLLAATAHAAEFKIGLHTFTVPDGLTVELAAGPPLVNRPITMAFGDAGELYVADSSGSNDKVEKQLADKTHRIVRLTSSKGDGKFDKSTVFADKMMFPEGTMWLDGSLYVSAPPQIWKLTDTDGDGVADKREVWFDGKTLTGCANDLHGPYAGPDGFIYWCKGGFAEQRFKLGDGRDFVSSASHLYRMRPDGTGFEAVITAGMDNPVDVVFTPSGERLLCGTFLQNPANGKRDGIYHAVYGGVWGKEHRCLKGHPRTGPLMPVMTQLGPAAACGLEMARLAGWGAEWKGNLFACNFNLRKVTRHILAPDGATFRTTDSDLLVSDQTDFHPTDVIEDEHGTGSLLIADTGGWYKICCPTSQLVKPDVLGAIYRVKNKDARKLMDVLGTGPEPNADTWVRQLEGNGDRTTYREHIVREHAARELVRLGDRAVPSLTESVANSANPLGERLASVWVLTRIPGETARAAVRRGLAPKEDAELRTAAALSAALWRDKGATDALLPLLADPDLHTRRAVAEALGRIGDKRAVAPLLATDTAGDRFLEHSVTYALYEIGDAPSLADAPAGPGKIAREMLAASLSTKPAPAMKPIPVEPAAPGPDAATLARQRARLEELLAASANGDAERGKKLFLDAKSLCTTCHAVGGVGGTFGPDLTKVGAIRTPRDLLEAIAFPSASFVRSYEPMLVKTKTGEALGFIKKDAPDEVVIATAPGVDARFPRAEVLSFQPAATSLMPPGYDGIFTPAQLADLVAFLKTAK